MRLGALPQLDDEHRVGVLVADSHLVRQTAGRCEGVAALREVSHQFIALAGDDTE